MTVCATLFGGRFTQTDPLQADVGSPYPSSYVYSSNNPMLYVDPSGERGQLPGCVWKNNPIASQQPEQLAFRTGGLSASQVPFASARSQILVPAPPPRLPIGVPPRTVPPRVYTPKRPSTTRPGGVLVVGGAGSTTTIGGASTTKVAPSTTAEPSSTTRPPVDCEAKRHACERGGELQLEEAQRRCPKGDTACLQRAQRAYYEHLQFCQSQYFDCVDSGGKPA